MDSETIHRRRWWSMTILSIALLAINVDNSILNVALPTIARELSATTSELQWMTPTFSSSPACS